MRRPESDNVKVSLKLDNEQRAIKKKKEKPATKNITVFDPV